MGVADVESGFPTNPEEIRKLTGLPAEASNQLSRDISNYLSERICLLRQGVVEEKEKLIGENE
jgi:hypothetical protein